MEKDNGIESLRAVAIILILSSHITNDGSLEPARGLYDYVNYSFQNIRLPLFTVISGYLYGANPVRNGQYFVFFHGKVRRILLPLVVVVTLEFLSKAYLPGVNNPTSINEIWKIYLYPYEHFWFLQVILIIFVVVGVLDNFQLIQSFGRWIFLFVLAIFWHFIYPHTGLDLPIFSLGTVSYLLPYFVFGYGLSRYNTYLHQTVALKIWFFLLLLSISIQQLGWFFDFSEFAEKRTIIGLIVSLSSCSLLFYFRRSVVGFSIIGSYAFTIYLYQGFGTAFGRRLAALIPEINPHFYFLLVVSVAVLFGIFIEIVLSKIPRIRTLMLGLR